NDQKAKAKANQKAKPNAKGKGKAGAAAKAKAQANAAAGDGVALADNGVLLTLTDVTEDSLVSIATAQGNFNFKLSEIPYGKYVERLNAAVEIERTAASHQVTNDRKTDHDYPSTAATDGTTYIAY